MRARATILSISTTLREMGERPVLRLRVSVQPPDGRPAYEAWILSAPRYHLAQTLRPGVSGPVLVDDRDPTRVWIDWDSVVGNIVPAADPEGGYDRAWLSGPHDAAGERMAGRAAPPDNAFWNKHWRSMVLGTGIALTAALIALIVAVVSGWVPDWLLSLVSIGVWGPLLLITLVVATLVQRWNTFAGEPARATVESVRWGYSTSNGQRVLRIRLTVQRSGSLPYEASVRAAPPFHLTRLLRTGAELPVLIDPRRPSKVRFDWARAERESN